MNKKGFSTIVITLIIILIGIVVTGIVWVTLKNILEKEAEIIEAKVQFFTERIDIISVKFNNSILSLTIKKPTGELILVGTETSSTSQIKADIISVVDLSGSMRACHNIDSACCSDLEGDLYIGDECYGVAKDKENACILCGGTWVDKLTPTQNANKDLINSILKFGGNRIGLVGYNSIVIDSASTELTGSITELNTIIDSWEAGDYTCICCGINKAAEKLEQQSSEEKVKAIIVMSDGDANRNCPEQGTGNAKQDAINAACDANSTLKNLTIYSVGVGNADETTLGGIAECGNGEYFAIENASELIEIYQNIVQEIEKKYKLIYELKLLIVFYNETSSYKETITNIPQALEMKTYHFNMQGKLTGEIQKIEIYPIIVTFSGKEIMGSALDVWKAE